MHEVDLSLNTSEGKIMNKRCIITRYNQNEICLESLDLTKKLNIKVTNSSIQQIDPNTCLIKLSDSTINYTLKFIKTDIIDNIINIFMSNTCKDLSDYHYIRNMYMNISDTESIKNMNNKIIEYGILKDKIELKDFKYLDVLLRYGNHTIITEFLQYITNNLLNIDMESESKTIPDHQRYMTFYHDFLNDNMPRERKDFIMSIIELAIEKDYEKYEYIDIINNIKEYNETMKYLNYCKKTRKEISEEAVAFFLEKKDTTEYSNILLCLSDYCVKEVRIYICSNIQLLIKNFNNALSNETSFNNIHNLYFSVMFIFDYDRENDLLPVYYQNIHQLFLIEMCKICEVMRSASEFRVMHYRVLDLLLFMLKQHDYFFPEFFITSGLLHFFKHFKNGNEEYTFFWSQFKKTIEYCNSILKDYVEE